MTQIIVTIVDAADIRAYECLVPDRVGVSRVALRLAELTHLPIVGTDGQPIRYGLIPKGGSLLAPDDVLADADLPSPIVLRLVPEIAAGSDDVGPDGIDDEFSEDEEIDVVVGEPTALVHDAHLDTKADVRIDAEVHRQIEEFAAANRNRECAGLLLGTVYSEGQGRVIHISAAIPADDAVGTRASVRIPLEAWEAMLKVRDFDYSHLRVLGWFHTHAGWGVFMSDADVFIHRHYFPHPSMVAYVLDPTTGRDGFFYWHDGKIGLCPSYGLVGAPSDVEPHRKARPKPTAATNPPRRFDTRDWVIGGLALAVLYLAVAGSPFANRSDTVRTPPKPAISAEQAVPDLKPAHKTTTTSKHAEAAKPAKPAKAPTSGVRMYAIGKRDNPWTICNRVYNDGDLGPALMRYNGLPSNPRLQIGQQIKLPSKETLKNLRKRQ